MAAMEKKRVEMKTRRVETGWFYAAPAVLNSLIPLITPRNKRHMNKHTKPGTTLAFLNADWRDFESTPAIQEKTQNAITLFDYHSLLSETGWKTTHRIECPLSTQRLTSTQVQRMQTKRILGTISRTLLIARRT
jgi:hypothetical protein